MIVTPMSEFKKFGTLFVQAFKEPSSSSIETVAKFSELSRKARKEGLLSLEDAINNLEDKFLKKVFKWLLMVLSQSQLRRYLNLR